MDAHRVTLSNEGDLLERIRRRPAMYLGTRSLTALLHFLDGYSEAKRELSVWPPTLLPIDFHDWVAYRLRFQLRSAGYAHMILERTPDEAKALDKFFDLLDEHSARIPKTIATIRRHPDSYTVPTVTYDQNHLETARGEIEFPEEASVVAFTNDPGFYLIRKVPERGSFRSSLSALNLPYRADLEFTTVLDHEQWDRLLKESAEYDRQFQERHQALTRQIAQEQGEEQWPPLRLHSTSSRPEATLERGAIEEMPDEDGK